MGNKQNSTVNMTNKKMNIFGETSGKKNSNNSMSREPIVTLQDENDLIVSTKNSNMNTNLRPHMLDRPGSKNELHMSNNFNPFNQQTQNTQHYRNPESLRPMSNMQGGEFNSTQIPVSKYSTQTYNSKRSNPNSNFLLDAPINHPNQNQYNLDMYYVFGNL